LTNQRIGPAALFLKFAFIGAVSFGGGIIAYLRRMLIDETHWMTPDEFLATLEISQTMPGLNSVNMSVLVGSRLAGPLGAFAAALGMILPGAVFIMGIGIAVIHAQRSFPIAHAAVVGIAGGAVGLLAQTTLKTGEHLFRKPLDMSLVVLTFVAMSIVKWPLFVVILVFGSISIFLYRPRKAPDA